MGRSALSCEAFASNVSDRGRCLGPPLGSDFILFGTFVVTEGVAPRTLRIDVRIQRARQDPLSVSGTGDEGELFALISSVGRDLRVHLGLRDRSAEATRSVRAALPQTTEATKLYAEGASRLRVLDAVAAKDLL